MVIPKSFFGRLDQVVGTFVWQASVPRVGRPILQLPLSEGGLALPNFRKYYWAAVLVSVRWWFTQDHTNPSVTLEAAIMGSYAGLTNLVYRGVRANNQITAPMRATVVVWGQVSRLLVEPGSFSPHIPLWGNPSLPHLRTVPDPQLWARYNITTLRDVMPEGRLLSFGVLKTKFGLPPWMFFRFLQLRHAIRAQFPDPITVEPHLVERLLTSR